MLYVRSPEHQRCADAVTQGEVGECFIDEVAGSPRPRAEAQAPAVISGERGHSCLQYPKNPRYPEET